MLWVTFSVQVMPPDRSNNFSTALRARSRTSICESEAVSEGGAAGRDCERDVTALKAKARTSRQNGFRAIRRTMAEFAADLWTLGIIGCENYRIDSQTSCSTARNSY